MSLTSSLGYGKPGSLFLDKEIMEILPHSLCFFSLDLTIATLFEITLVVDVAYKIWDQRFFSDGVDTCVGVYIYMYLHAPTCRIDRWIAGEDESGR